MATAFIVGPRTGRARAVNRRRHGCWSCGDDGRSRRRSRRGFARPRTAPGASAAAPASAPGKAPSTAPSVPFCRLAVRVSEQSAPDVSSAVLRGGKDVRDALLEVSAHHRRLARRACRRRRHGVQRRGARRPGRGSPRALSPNAAAAVASGRDARRRRDRHGGVARRACPRHLARPYGGAGCGRGRQHEAIDRVDVVRVVVRAVLHRLLLCEQIGEEHAVAVGQRG